jgi:hypothetical protein
MAWKKGPLPKNTYGWGGVVPTDMTGVGFYMADFCGDKVKIVGNGDSRTLSADEVRYYDNSITLPPLSNLQAE